MGLDNGALNAYSIDNLLGNETHMSNTLMEKCLAKGIRVTSQRQIIVGVIEESEDHPDVDQLYRRAVQEDETISIATVYR